MRKTLAAFFVSTLMLLGIGIVLVASASSVRAMGLYGDPHYFLRKQLISLAISAILFCIALKLDYRIWKRHPALTAALFAIAVILLAVTICPGLRHRVNGSCRWLVIAGHRIGQPSEFAKIIMVIVTACWMDAIGGESRRFIKGVVAPMAMIGIVAGLLLAEPDFGGTFVIGTTCLAIMFVAGTRLWHLALISICAVLAVGVLLVNNENRMARISQYLGDGKAAQLISSLSSMRHSGSSKPETAPPAASDGKDDDKSVYQLNQSILAFKNGGPWGVGFNQSIQKYSYLPEAHTDFIFSIGGEEFGFIFSIGVLALYLVILVCGFLISCHAQDRLGRLLAFGMTFLLIFQAVFNIGVVTGCLPTKGLALPFISYGGTSLMSVMAACGILMNIGHRISFLENTARNQIAKNALTEI